MVCEVFSRACSLGLVVLSLLVLLRCCDCRTAAKAVKTPAGSSCLGQGVGVGGDSRCTFAFSFESGFVVGIREFLDLPFSFFLSSSETYGCLSRSLLHTKIFTADRD
ncbi:hypothetical protein B0T24DRAFT_608192 [Lasiosphaeria ovina]|uniref:Secreted protein n=1 Tax=Lasiosphaeria ovina TaxID=92902 RepID=A0AAE0NMW2_9PEZI|nr:hypothetical protein B0T24DRAFT_608192 [Lasiosphaeria ovina]